MQAAMDRLDGFTRRHGRLVALAWLVLLLAALPFTARQTEHLTSGGFEVPGSGSEAVERGLKAFDGAQRSQLAVVLARRPGSDRAEVRRAVERVRDGARTTAHVSVSREALAAAERRSAGAPITVVPLHVSGTQDDAANAATDLRRELKIGDAPAGERVELHLVGQQALWAGM